VWYIHAPNDNEKAKNQIQKDCRSIREEIEIFIDGAKSESLQSGRRKWKGCGGKSAARRSDFAEAG
jgi:hypothetical protein